MGWSAMRKSCEAIGNALGTTSGTPGASMSRKPTKQPDRHQQVIMAQQFRSGPLPASQELEHYNQIVPGAAERIIAMAEGEQGHRHKVEGRHSVQRIVAQIVSSLMGLAFVGLAWFMVYTERTEHLTSMLWAGAAVIGAVLGVRLLSGRQKSNGEA